MISGINNGQSNLMQLLLSAMKGGSSTSSTDATSSSSQNDLSSIGSSEKSQDSGFLSCLQDNFSKIDGNNDGQISKDEIGTYFKNNRPMGPPPGMVIEGQDPTAATTSDDSVDSISSTEHKGRAHGKGKLEKAFNQLDTNQDGTLSKEELEAATTNTATQTANQTSTGNEVADAFSAIWDKVNSTGSLTNLIDQITKNLASSYATQSASGAAANSSLSLSV